MIKSIAVNVTLCYRKRGSFYLALLISVFFAFTSYGAENTEDYRAVFDADYYYNQHPDLQAAIGYDAEKLFHHFVSAGAKEGRSGNEEFNLRAYVFHNPDLLNSYNTNLSSYCRHYATLGKAEGRISLPQENKSSFIGTYSTSYNNTIPRAVNVELAVQRINGVTLQPGELFSFSHTILSRVPQNEYVMAPAIGGNEYGGGICQVSSTLYAAMCHALIPAIERWPHSSGVSYLPGGLDATISEGCKDLKFINPFDGPLMIEATTNEGIITISLLREVQEMEETVEAETVKAEAVEGETIPQEPEADPNKEIGPGIF